MGTPTGLAEKIVDDVSMFHACEQCGLCSSACPLTGVDGFNVRRVLRHVELDLTDVIAASPYPWSCTTCGRCEEVCPNGIAILDIIRPLRSLSPPEFIPAAPPCIEACPAGVDIPGYLRLIAEGQIDKAYALIREKVPFPGILGRVCTHPCEDACRRGEVNEPIAICALKRYAADNAARLPEQIWNVEKDTGHRVAIVGAGPAGLTAAFYLRRKGHHITLFEEMPKPGGMLRFGIPDFRLPKNVVDAELKEILDLGIEVKVNRKMGRDFDLDSLRADGYEAIFIAVGASISKRIDLFGGDHHDALWGIDFLREVNEGKEIALKDKVLVIGGGNVAIDVALTALRLGAKEVTLACLECREEMPANQWEIEQAMKEGVIIMPSWGPHKILEESGTITGAELVRCTSVFDDGGNFCPTFANIRETVRTDQVILAIGQAPDLSCIGSIGEILVENDCIVFDAETLETGMPGVFVGGDVVKAPGTIIDAIAAGRQAACSIDSFLGGNGDISESGRGNGQLAMDETASRPYTGKREEGFADLKREEMPTMPLDKRHEGFAEVELGFDEEQAKREAKRCLQCDLEIQLAKESLRSRET
ncbi:MAG: FAD-dependent oxidoreductase [Deltaproteobacteria bacterium]|nr:FAD-dependent oxidoreductase [Deltaproteobacteria bacterium]MBW2076769.1 FAD-dependent oxidoreductase [Deltaproteobacteria bacterium]